MGFIVKVVWYRCTYVSGVTCLVALQFWQFRLLSCYGKAKPERHTSYNCHRARWMH